jgi:CheY-like chemotaxis protein
MRMSGEIISVRILAICASEPDGELLRQGAAFAAIPAFFSHVVTAAAARAALEEGKIDIVLLDSAMANRDAKEVFAAVRAARNPPSVVLVVPSSDAALDPAAGVAAAIAVKPVKVSDAKALIEGCTRLKVPSRVLVVDDSSTMRSIVRKILSGCCFPLDVSEAGDGIEALKQIKVGKFDFVFLDYHMPGLDGFETLAQLKRQYSRMEVVMMTSAPDEALAARAREAGAAAFLKKPFYPSDIDGILFAFHRLRPPPP